MKTLLDWQPDLTDLATTGPGRFSVFVWDGVTGTEQTMCPEGLEAANYAEAYAKALAWVTEYNQTTGSLLGLIGPNRIG